MGSPIAKIEPNACIRVLRGMRVILDADLADLYGVKTTVLNQAVSRNAERFPEDFMFRLTREEISRISQSVISSRLKYSKRVTAFTENGVAMLSGVLNSPRAVQANIEIMRAFTRLRGAHAIHRSVLKKLAVLERKVFGHEDQLAILAEAITELRGDEAPRDRRMGFKP